MYSTSALSWEVDGGILWAKIISNRQWRYAPFTYRGLVEFLTMAEEVLDSLGEDQEARQEAAHQLICDVLV